METKKKLDKYVRIFMSLALCIVGFGFFENTGVSAITMTITTLATIVVFLYPHIFEMEKLFQDPRDTQ